MSANRQTAVGVFVVGGVGLAIGAILFFGQFHFGATIRTAAIVFQDSISGLSIGAPISFRGVQVGSVESIGIEFDPKTHIAYIPVVVQLNKDNVRVSQHDPNDEVLSRLIARGLRAEINTLSFVTGQSEIDLSLDPAAPAVLHPQITDLPEIPTKVSDLQRVKQQLSQLPLREMSDNANATLRSIRLLIDRLNVDIPPLVASFKATSDSSQATIEAGARAIADFQARLDPAIDAVGRLARSGDTQVTQRGADLHDLLAQTKQTVLRARDLVNNLQSMTSDRAGPRIDSEATLRDLAAAAAALRGFASDVEHNPQLLLTGRRP
jgi:paraquat-inducible protein B